MNELELPSRRTSRMVGVLFLAAFLTYGVGSTVVTIITGVPDYLDAASSNPLFTTGAVLMLANSAVVVLIGVLMFPVLARHSSAVAAGYLGTRLFEAALLSVGVVSLLSLTAIGTQYRADAPDAGYLQALGALAINGNLLSYQVAMAGLGIGSVFFCSLLLRARLVPRFLAVWGLAGYAVFAAGAVLELLGFAGFGMIFTVPGGLFELFFGIWLIARGFTTVRPAAVPGDRLPVH
jgi:hypothetical protein